ncbi:hypothetical protein DFJ73DRAFT_853693 [Zopfochytrium polystomum]|nr:hypothetical protein DFJ73DRAFT_853693 [Zopfochytrium polystomum]
MSADAAAAAATAASSTAATPSAFEGALAQGIAGVISQPIIELDMRVVAVQSTQAELMKEMDKLTAELQQILAAVDPPPLESILTRLAAVRKRLIAVNAILKAVSERLDRTFSMAASATGRSTLRSAARNSVGAG